MPPVETEKKNLTWLWVLICIAIVIAIAVIVIVLAGRKKDPYKKNYKYKKA
jgi:bacteriorhodopsin